VQDTVFVVTGDTLGRGSDELGRQLMAKFILQLATQSPRPHAVVFYNAGVKLIADDSTCLEGIRTLEHDGVEILACGTCTGYFGITDRVAAGRVTDMREIVATIIAAAKVVTV